MIHIEKIRRESEAEFERLIADIRDDLNSENKTLWFEVPREYCEYLCDDASDAFIVSLLALAVKTGQDIKCDAAMSSRLYYNLMMTVIPLFKKILQAEKDIFLFVENKEFLVDERATSVGSCVSLGIDSLASYFLQQESYVPKNMHVTHLSLFNCGQLGDYDLKEAEENLRKSLHDSGQFAEEEGLPIFGVNSNINDYYKESNVMLLQSFVLRTIGCALALQGRMNRYVYASSYSIEDVKCSTEDASCMEATFIPLLSTERMAVILGSPMMTRVEKTKYIAKYSQTAKHLRVCWAEQFANNKISDLKYLRNRQKINCGWCEKCMRTLFTLEVLGEDLAKYQATFEISKYYEHRSDYVVKVFKHSKKNIFYKEIVDLIERAGRMREFKRFILKYKIKKELRRLLKPLRGQSPKGWIRRENVI